MLSRSRIRWSQLPNYITCSRIFLAKVAIICYLFAFVDQPYLYQWSINWNNQLKSYFAIPISVFVGGIIFIIAASTDWLDGYLARKYACTTDLGKILDPIADKLLVNGVLVVLVSYKQVMPAVLLVIFIARDIGMNTLRMFLLHQGIVVPANNSGKWKTLLQMLGIIVLTFGFWFNQKSQLTDYQADWLLFYWLVQNGPMVISAILAIASLIRYGLVYLKKTS